MVEIAAVAVALVLVPLTGGRFGQLARIHFHGFWMLFLALGIQVGLTIVTMPRDRVDTVGFALLLVSYVMILAFCTANLRITGMGVVAIGIALNVTVIALNQGMPYKVARGESPDTTVKHRPERHDDVLKLLDDRIIVPGPLSEAISFGDLIIAVGLVDVVWRASRSRRRRSAHPDRDLVRADAGGGARDRTAPDPGEAATWLDDARPRPEPVKDRPGGVEGPRPARARPRARDRWPGRAPRESAHPSLLRLRRATANAGAKEPATIDLVTSGRPAGPPVSDAQARVERPAFDRPFEGPEDPGVIDISGT